MDNALGEASLPSKAEEVLRKFFNEMSTFMINQSEASISKRRARTKSVSLTKPHGRSSAAAMGGATETI